MASSRKSKATPPAVRAATTPAAPDATPSYWWWLMVLVPVLFNAIALAPELATGVPSKNDSALHLLLIHAASDAVRAGNNPIDFWIPQLELGFPQFVYYQHLPHLAVVALHRLLLGTVDLETVFHAVRYLLLVIFPITVAWSMRHMGFSTVAAGFGAAASSLVSGNGRYGFEYNSFIWRGIGLYTQIWGMHLSFLTLACVSRTIKDGRGYVRSAALFAALSLSHLVYAYMMVVTTGLVVLVATATPWTSRNAWRAMVPRAARLAVIGGLAVVFASYMLLPFVQSSHAYLSSLPGLPTTFRPIARVVASIVQGRLLDYERFPILTLLTGVGIVAAVMRRGPLRVLALAGLTTWLTLYLGRSFTQSIGGALPAHSGFVSYRFVGSVELFAILLIGIGAEGLWDALRNTRILPSRIQVTLGALLLSVLLIPAFVERAGFYAGNRQIINETRVALAADVDLQAVLSLLQRDSASARYSGRVYAGPRSGWGGKLMVGPSLRVFDVVNAHRIPSVANPFQGLALNSGLLYSFRDGDIGLFDAFDVRTVITPTVATVPPFYQLALRTNRYSVWHVPSTGIAHYVAITGRRAASSQRELYIGASDWFVSAAPGAHQATRWDYPARRTSDTTFKPISRCADGGHTLEEHVESQRITLVMECASAGVIALKMSYHPNWRVRVDDRVVQTYMVSPSFIGFEVPAGRHRIEARYVPTPSKLPLLLLGFIALAAAFGFRHRLDMPARWVVRRVGAPHA